MALTKFITDVENISKLPDRPNQNNGLSAAQLKSRFDLGVSDVKKYINETLTVEIDEALTKTLTVADIANKVDKVAGKGLSTNDYDNIEKAKVAGNTLARHTHANKVALDGIVEVTQVLGNATDKVPSEKAVVDAMGEAGAGDMLKSVYDPDNDGKFSADIIVDGITNKVYTETEKSKLAGIDEGANNYIHPTTAGNKHIPSGGEIGQILKNTASGTVDWADDTPGIDIVNNLTETVTGKALDATQGKVLNDLVSTKAGKSTIQNKTLFSASWTGTEAPYTYTLSVTGVTTTSVQEILPTTTITREQLTALMDATIQDGGQSANSITLKAWGTKPAIDIPIRVILRGDM